MVEQSIIDYISRLRAAGYDAGTIRTQLIQAGYDPRQVDQALQTGQRKVISAKTLALIGAGILVLVLIGIAILTFTAPEPKYVELSLQATQTQLAAGDRFTFLKQLSSDQEARVTVQLQHTIVDAANQQVAQRQETVTVAQALSTQTQIPLPSTLNPGQYTLTTIATYDGKTAQAKLNFAIVEPTQAQPVLGATPELKPAALDCPTDCDDLNACTQDSCVKGKCTHVAIKPCCGNLICEAGETKTSCAEDCVQREKTPDQLVQQAAQLSATDPQTAIAICTSLGRTRYADACYAEVAIGSRNANICQNVLEEPTKDRCYLEFASELSDFSSCSLIVNKYLAQSCNALSRISAAQAATPDIEA